MAELFRRVFKPVGSNAYYDKYQKDFERLTKDINGLKAKKAARKRSKDGVNYKFIIAGMLLTVLLFLHAKWRASFPAGTYALWETVLHVVPVVAMPLLTYVAVKSSNSLVGLRDRWDDRRLGRLQARLAHKLAELKDSTRYDRTLALLQKYDPSYRPPAPARPLAPRRNGQAAVGAAAGVAGVAPSSSKWMGVLDSVASKLVAADPVLLQSLRDAKAEVEMLRAHLAAAQWHYLQVVAENRGYRLQLGLPVAEEPAWTQEQLLQQQQSAPPLLQSGVADGVPTLAGSNASTPRGNGHAEGSMENGGGGGGGGSTNGPVEAEAQLVGLAAAAEDSGAGTSGGKARAAATAPARASPPEAAAAATGAGTEAVAVASEPLDIAQAPAAARKGTSPRKGKASRSQSGKRR